MMIETKTIQLWPGGESVTYSGDWRTDALLIVEGGDEYALRPATAEETRAIRIEARARQIGEQDILCCDSALVGALIDLHSCGDLGSAFGIENLTPDPDSMDAAEMREYLEDRGVDLFDCDDCNSTGRVDELRDLMRENAEPAEIFEWWRVSSWLCRRLREIGEPVIDNDYGYWWGRTCTGQGWIMDGTLQRIAAELEDRA